MLTDDETGQPQRRRLADVVDRLHPAVLGVLAAPKGLDIEVADPFIYDPADSEKPPRHALVLAVGVEGDRERVALLAALADAHVAGVVLKLADEASPGLLAAADDNGVALLSAPPVLSWGQLYTLLLTAATVLGPADPEVADVPLGDLFALANAVAAMVGGATTIEDPQNHVLAYSSLDHPIDPPRQETILGRAVPPSWIRRLHEAGVFRRLWQTDDVVRIDFDDVDYLRRMATAVRAGGEMLGSIWVIEGNQALGPEAERALREAADIAALHLLRHRSAHDVERRRRAEALLALIEGRGNVQTAESVLGLDPHSPVGVIAFDVGGDDADAVARARRVADLVAVYSESYRRQAACAASGRRVYALVPVGGTDDRLRGLAEAIVERARDTLHVDLVAGIGSMVEGLGRVPESRREADQAATVLLRRTRSPVAHVEEVRSQVVLERLRELAGLHPELAVGPLRALAEQDVSKGTAWVASLRAYLDCFGDMAAAAAHVNVHPNTFRYRIRRITEVFGLDLTDPDERLVAELQLRLLDDAS